jgi:exodeoxyribonuclease VIII
MSEWLPNYPEHDYHQRPELSSHGMMEFIKSPYKFYRKNVVKDVNSFIKSDAMMLGSLVHHLVLEPKRPVYVMPDVDGRTKAGKEAKEAVTNSTPPQEMIYSFKDHSKATDIVKALTEHEEANKWLFESNFKTELTGLAEFNGIETRLRCDMINDKYIVDLKTTSDASPKSFGRFTENNGYLIQAAWYCMMSKQIDGMDREFKIIAVETEAPYEVGLYTIPHSIILKEQTKIKKYLAKYKQCLDSQYWPRLCKEFQDIEISTWYFQNDVV